MGLEGWKLVMVQNSHMFVAQDTNSQTAPPNGVSAAQIRDYGANNWHSA